MKLSNLMNIQSVLDKAVKEKYLAGVNALVYKDGREIGYWQAGYADVENNVPFSRSTISRMFSMTKTVTSVAAMTLVQEGKLDPAEELGCYLPEFWNLQVSEGFGPEGKYHKSQRNILIQDLLNMTSGYGYGGHGNSFCVGENLVADLIDQINYDEGDKGKNEITTMEVARRLAAIPVVFEPGTDYQYGLSADILGAVIEKVTGKKFSDYLKEKIFYPLGMYDTDFYVPPEKQDRLSKVYASVYKKEEGCNVLEPFAANHLGIQYKMNHAPAFESGGAGLCSTIDDYMKFTLMLTNCGELNGHRILEPKTVEYMSKAKLTDELQKKFDAKMQHLPGYTYSNLMRIAYDKGKCRALTEDGEFGWDGWLGPYLSVDIKNQLAIVMTMQRVDSGTTTTTRKVKNIIYSSL